ncbi:MAG: potassium channel family protein [Candidatus Cyclobacteriaceae bacterium M2_1C_046]
MKYIVVGLGNFGAALSKKLTHLGHEVIGVDKNMAKVNAIKDIISHSVALDCTDPQAVHNLPLKESDVVIISIGEDEAASIMATAVMKQSKVNRIISRAVTPLQSTVLEAMGIHEILHPEEDAAERLAKRLNIKGIIDSFEVTEKYNIVEAKVPSRYVGMSLEEAGFLREYNILVLTTMKERTETSVLGTKKKSKEAQGVANAKTILKEDDIIVLYGNIDDINRLLAEESD